MRPAGQPKRPGAGVRGNPATARAWRIAVCAGTELSLAGAAYAQSERPEPPSLLDEIVVTATRVETNLQQTPMSVQAFTGERLELAGIDAGRDLGIMVPNVVLNPSVGGQRNSTMIVRGLPGVTTYVDGIWFGMGDSVGFQQKHFVELERVEVLRGPQGTHFGRNTNGGAIQIVTRLPAEEFGARLDVELGEFDRRALKLAVDLPISDRLRTKWTAASNESDGFLESQTAPFSLGAEDDSLLRADILWQPRDDFSLRFNVSDEDRHGSDARIVRISNPNNPVYIAYNVLAGNPNYLAQARSIDPGFPDPPFPLAGDRYTPETHEPGFPGGSLGRWQTRSDTAGPTAIVDQRYAMLTLDWRINDRFSLESLSSYVENDTRQITDWDASEFTQALDMSRTHYQGTTQEVHLTGNHFNGRLRSLIGLYHSDNWFWARGSGWWFWEFAVPNTGPNPGLPGPPGVGGRPLVSLPARDYVRTWGATVGNPAVANFVPLTFVTSDRLRRGEDSEGALFGELTIGLVDRLDLTVGFRFTEDMQEDLVEYLPADAFRPIEPGRVPSGDPYAAAAVITAAEGADLGTISTPRVSIGYQPTDEIYVYSSYAEGFTSGAVVNNPYVAEPIVLGPEVVRTRELGLRSEWLGHRLRLNATYFDSRWDGLRVPRTIPDPNNPGLFLPAAILTDDGLAKATGLELELSYLPGERWRIDLALGLLDTEYLEVGDPPANGTGLQPGIPFMYAPDTSYSVSLRYRWPLAGGGELLFAGDYGWMDDYERALASEYQPRNADGSNKLEPAYGLLNARIVYAPARSHWGLSLFGTNLTNEWYVNGGLDTGLAWGYDFGTIGRPREVGVGVQFLFD
jgi:iron complex outermembrane receptor protein